LGAFVKSSQFNKKIIESTNNPIILCSCTPRMKRIIIEAGFKNLSLNKELVEVLVKKDIAIRHQFVTDEVMKITASVQSPIFLKDYEMLFDPRYNIDVIRLFIELARRRQVVIEWCGKLEDDGLVYSTPEYRDYHSYNINDYDIICIA
jgi:hypothetical protein